MKLRTVKLMPEVDLRLAAYARERHQTPEQVAAAAIERYLHEHADVVLRIADARRAAEKSRG